MNPSTAQATVLVDELIRNDVRQVVVCPGSRNAPLSMALHDADQAGRLTMHVRIDERTAAFLALGLAKASGRPVAMVCTSGTAAANLHPAVLEAYHSGVGIILLTADRPPELHGTGANQTIDQHGLFGSAAIALDFPVAERRGGQNQVWRGLVCRAVAQAEHGRPVQVNIPFREPLVPTFEPRWPEPLDGRPGDLRWTTSAAFAAGIGPVLAGALLMVAGCGFAYSVGLQRRFRQAVPDATMGQSFGLMTTGLMTFQGIGPALWGALAEWVPVGVAIALSGVATVLTAVWIGFGGVLTEPKTPVPTYREDR